MFSLSSAPPEKFAFFERERPIESISSINMIQGDFSFACLNRSRTRETPTPTNISIKSDPDKLKKGTLASPATAFAKRVLPVPGGPTSSTPLGIFPPKSVYFLGLLRKSIISRTSCFASSMPATSPKSTFVYSPLVNSFACDFPMLKMLPAPPPPVTPRPILRKINTHINTNRSRGNIHVKKLPI